MALHLHTGKILHFLNEQTPIYFEEGALLVDEASGKVVECGDKTGIMQGYPEVSCTHHLGKLITPGFIDTHVHYPQISVMASYGKQLLDWLNQYTFPVEAQFSDPEVCRQGSEFFLDQCFQHGTTTAMVFATSHKASVDEFFKVSQQRNARMICGKVLMDCHGPATLLDSAQSSYDQSKALIETWHGNGRNLYAITPRFALTSTAAQLAMAGDLLREHPGVYLQTHLAENKQEVQQISQCFPARKDYVDVYDHYGLLGNYSTFAHGIHLSENELERLAATQSKIAFCPSSNLFLGSGLLNLARVKQAGVQISLATDVGAGTYLSMLQTLADAYKVAQLTGYSLCPFESFYQITLGNSRALCLDHLIGNFEAGKEADFVVLDLHASELLTNKMNACQNLSEQLFSLMMLGDDRVVDQTYVSSLNVYTKKAQ